MVHQITTPLPYRLTEAELYHFDTRGFLVREGFLSPEGCREIGAALAPLWRAQDDTGRLYRAEVMDGVPFFADLAARIAATSGVYDTINQPFRLIEGYALRRCDGSVQPLHNGRSNKNKSAYGESRRAMWRDHSYHDGLLYCMMVKALVYLSDVAEPADGPFAVVEGSHKANYPFPLPRSEFKRGAGFDRPGVHPVYVRAGDLLLLNEALTHGSFPKSSPDDRVFVAFSFAPSFVVDYVKLPKDANGLTTAGFCE
jgi:hypothetical protein